MDPAHDPHAASAPFPTIPAAATHRQRAARPRRQAGPFRSDHALTSSSSGRRLGGDPASLAAGTGPRPSTAGGSRPSAFVFCVDATTSDRAAQEDPASPGTWGSSPGAGFVFGSGATGPPEMKRSSSLGSSGASLCGLSASALEELIRGESFGKQSDDSRGTDSVLLEVNAGYSFGDDGGCERSTETSSSLVSQPVNSAKCTDVNDSMEFPKDSGNSSVAHSLDDEGYSTKDGGKLSANGGNVEHGLFVFGECASAPPRCGVKKLDSPDKGDATASSERHNLSAPEDGRCIKLQLSPGTSNRDAPHSRPHETEKGRNTAPSNIGSEDDILKVSFTKLPDGMQTQSTLVAESELGEYGSFDEKSFTLHDPSSASKDKGVVKAMSMNRRAVKPKKFSSARQVSSSRTVLAVDSYSAKVIPEANLNSEQSGKVGFRLGESDIVVDNSCPQEADATQTAEISHDGRRLIFSANLKNSGHSDSTFASSTFDQSKLRSQRRHNKKSSEGMATNNTTYVQSLTTSAISRAQTEVLATQLDTVLTTQWTEYRKAEPTAVTSAKTENFGCQEDCETWRIRGNQAYAAGQLAKAEEYYTHGINSVSSDEASRKALMLCYSNRAATRISLGRMRDALSDCRKATKIDSGFLKAQIRAANCLLALGDIKEAQKGFEFCLKSNEAANLNHKIVEEASDGLQKAQKVSSLILQSEEYLIKKEFDKIPSALQMITDALAISFHSDNLMKMKAEAMLLLRRYEEVIRFCEETLHLAERNSVSVCLDEHPENINLDSCYSVKAWRYYLIAKSYFLMGKLEEAHQFLKKYEQATFVEYMCGKQSQQSVSSLLKAISELLRLKVAGNEAFQAGKYSEAVEHYTAALLSNTESLHFSAICFGNRAAAYQAMGQILDSIADCSLAVALDPAYCKVISRRASLYELIRDYSQAENDLRRLISLLEEQLRENMSMSSEKLDNVRNNLHRANLRLSALERDARKRTSLNMYLILGIEPSCSAADIKKAYRKAALRHHPDKAGNFLVRSENINDTVWTEIVNAIRRDAGYLFKIIGKAYAILSDPTMKSK